MSPRTVAALLFAVLAGLFLLAAGREFRNVADSPVVGRYLFLVVLCGLLAALLYLDPLQYLEQVLSRR
jgi:hypothetical protein